MLTVVPGEGSGEEGGKDGSPSLIDEIVREGARRMLAQALQAEVEAYIAAHAAERDENGRRLVVRNGSHQSREVLTSAGAIEVTVRRVNDKRTDPATGERQRFSSAILPLAPGAKDSAGPSPRSHDGRGGSARHGPGGIPRPGNVELNISPIMWTRGLCGVWRLIR